MIKGFGHVPITSLLALRLIAGSAELAAAAAGCVQGVQRGVACLQDVR